MPSATVTIDLDALLHNCRVIQEKCPKQGIIAIVKADAYGHGLLEVAETLAPHVAMFAVARLEDAQRLRQAHIDLPVLLLTGFTGLDELQHAIALNADIVLHHETQLKQLEARSTQLPKSIRLWVKVQSCMHRLGFAPENSHSVLARLDALGQKPIGMMTHLPSAESDALDSIESQCANFLSITQSFEGETSIANSAGVFKHATYMAQHSTMVRPGLSIYGVSPLPDQSAAELDLKPVMTFQAHIIADFILAENESIGYGLAYTAHRSERVLIVAVGYGDGYSRVDNGMVFVEGERAPIRGYVSMDMMAVAVSEHNTAQVGGCVELWGKNLPIEEVAKAQGRSTYEVLMPLASRVRKYYPVKKPLMEIT